MCGISYRKYGTIKNVLEAQEDRGLDGIGLLYEKEGKPFIHKFFVTSENHWEEQTSEDLSSTLYHFPNNQYTKHQKADLYQDILKYRPILDKNTFVFMHHRKSSIGAKNLENTHPFKGEKFILAQNGTSNDIHAWGIVEGIPVESTDTHCLLHYIETKCENIEDVVNKLEVLSLRGVSVGVGCIYSIKEKQLLFYSDAERSIYIKYEEGNKNRVEYIQSVKDNPPFNTTYETAGFIIVDMEGNIIKERLVNLNKERLNKAHLSNLSAFYGGYHNQPPYTYTQEKNTPKKKNEKTENQIKEIEELYKDEELTIQTTSPYDIINDFKFIKEEWKKIVLINNPTPQEKAQRTRLFSILTNIEKMKKPVLDLYIEEVNSIYISEPSGDFFQEINSEILEIQNSYKELKL